MGFVTILDEPWLIASFAEPQAMLSWSVARPGFVLSDTVAWLEVTGRDLCMATDPRSYLRDRLAERGVPGAVGMMTSRHVRCHHQAGARVGRIHARCLVTLDLSNGSHVAEPAATGSGPGTINILCWVSAPLTRAARIELVSIVAEARTAAVLEAGYHRPGQARPVTGTGTDCVVVACPRGAGEPFAGLHTQAGRAAGDCVYRASSEAVAVWQDHVGET